jgi:MFS family permease
MRPGYNTGLSMEKRFHYGWVNLVLAALAMVATLPGRTQGLGLVTEPLLADWGMSRVVFAQVNLWATLFGAVLCLPVGRFTDRWGARVVMSCVALGLGLAVLGMTFARSIGVLFVLLTLTRALGQSALSVVSLALVGKWFARRLNLAMGIFALLVAMGFIAAFPAVGAAVLASGWRAAWTGVGVGVLVMAVLAFLFVRNAPSLDDGDVEALALQPGDLTLGEALRTPAFWLFALASAAFGLVYSGIALFNQSILELRGFPAETYHRTLVISTMVGLVCNFVAGWAGQKWPMQRLMGVGMLMLGLSLLGLPLVRTGVHVDLYAATMGAAGGIVTVVFFSVWGQVFGRTHLGRIQGAAQATTVVASAVGPLLLAETLARTGSYDLLFWGLAAVVAGLGVGAWVVPMPARRGLLS